MREKKLKMLWENWGRGCGGRKMGLGFVEEGGHICLIKIYFI